MSMKQNNNHKHLYMCLTGDIDYFEIETIEGCLSPLFKVLNKYDVKMTFAITAKAVKDYPERAEYVLKQGHEVAVHGDEHRPFYGSLEEQAERIEKAKRIFRDVLGIVPRGFRSPQLRHDENTYLALIEAGFLYDSSRARNEVLARIPGITNFSFDMGVFPLVKPFLGFAASFLSRQVPARPFFIHNRLVELPVTGPSDWQLILSELGPRYTPDRALRITGIWLNIMQDMKQKDNRMFVVMIHPYIMSPLYVEAIDILLESVVNDNEVELKLLGDVAQSFVSQNKGAEIQVNALGRGQAIASDRNP